MSTFSKKRTFLKIITFHGYLRKMWQFCRSSLTTTISFSHKRVIHLFNFGYNRGIMSANMKSNILMRKKIRLRDLSFDEESISLAPGHSTPKRARTKKILGESQEVSSSVCRDSPIQLTQNGVNDVAWDWHSPDTEKGYAKYEGIRCVGTPKQLRHVLNKHNSNSPIVYKPIKRKLITQSSTGGATILQAELQALSNKFKLDQNEVNTDASNKKNHNTVAVIAEKFKNLNEFHGQSVVVIRKPDETCTMKNGEGNVLKFFGDYERKVEYLFDDSTDDCMMRYSQRVEEGLRPEQEKKRMNIVHKYRDHCGKSPNPIKNKPTRSSFMTKVSESQSQVVKSSPKDLKSLKSLNICSKLINNRCEPRQTHGEQLPEHKSRTSINIDSKLVLSSLSILSYPPISNSLSGKSHFQTEKLTIAEKSVSEAPSNSTSRLELGSCMSKPVLNGKQVGSLANKKKIILEAHSLDIVDTRNDNFHESISSYKIQSLSFHMTNATLPTKKSHSLRKQTNSPLLKSCVDTSQEPCLEVVVKPKNYDLISSGTNIWFDSDIISTEKKNSGSRKKDKPRGIDHLLEQNISASSRIPGRGTFFSDENSIHRIPCETLNHVEMKQSSHFSEIDSFQNLKIEGSVRTEASVMQCTPEEIEKKRMEAKMRLEAKKKFDRCLSPFSSVKG